MADVLSLPTAERDKLAAKHVLNKILWVHPVGGARYFKDDEGFFISEKLSHADFDQMLLCEIRDNWQDPQLRQFAITLERIQIERYGNGGYPKWMTRYSAMMVDAGDVRDAALLVLAEKGEI